MLNYIWILYIIIYILVFGNAYEVNVLAPCFDGNIQIFESIFNEFNAYAKEKNLNFKLKIDYVKYEKAVESYHYFKSIVEELLKKNKNGNRYDLYFYDNDYKAEYSPYLMDLNYILTEQHINLYDPKIIKDTCIYHNKLIGLVKLISYYIFIN